MIELKGALHVHSTYSDGTGTVSDIIAAARAAGADFVLLSDHDTLAAKREGWDGWHDGVYLLAGFEVTPGWRGHCVVVGVDRCMGYALMSEKDYLEDVGRQGGFAFAAHPMGEHKLGFNIKHARWNRWHDLNLTGMEIWSYMHDWIADLQFWRVHEYYDFCKHPEKRIAGPNPELLRLWDRIGARRRFVGVSGLDCHARRMPIMDITLFPYEDMFKALRTHLFVEELKGDGTDGPRLMRALASGDCFVGYDLAADSSGMQFGGHCSCGRDLRMGEEHPYHGTVSLEMHVPLQAELTLLKDGRTVQKAVARSITVEVDSPGVYRAEARLPDMPWIFTNPIYLRERSWIAGATDVD